MANRIRDVYVVNHRLDPHETELRIHVELDEWTPTTEIKGRLMGPRCVYRSTVEIAYPMRPVGQTLLSALDSGRQECLPYLELRVIIPEACWWEPKTPFLYQGPLELWQDGVLCERRNLSELICTLQNGANGWWLNGRPYVLRGKALELPFDEMQARQWHDDGINTLLTGAETNQSESDLYALADRFGFFVMDAHGFAWLAQPESK